VISSNAVNGQPSSRSGSRLYGCPTIRPEHLCNASGSHFAGLGRCDEIWRFKLGPMANLELVALVVTDYNPANRFFMDVLQFELVEETPSLTNEGRPKRWVVVRRVGAKAGILLARADGEQSGVIGRQFAGRVGLPSASMTSMHPTSEWWLWAFQFISLRRIEPYGKVAVSLDLGTVQTPLLKMPGVQYPWRPITHAPGRLR
jgi:catechol 2,3-dioxygenase-like lactoylglutathione lyase family enzyme